MAEYKTYELLFAKINKDLAKSLQRVSIFAQNKWKSLIYEKFYEAYPNPKMYERTFEVLNSISVFNVVKVGDTYEVIVKYDEDKINYYPETDTLWQKHGTPSIMGELIEDGWNHVYKGVTTKHEGTHALQDMLSYVSSNEFKEKFKDEMRKYGYVVI